MTEPLQQCEGFFGFIYLIHFIKPQLNKLWKSKGFLGIIV
jgi:hypothetical protein